ncbi:MAG: hypothetical protein IKK43_05305 [Clostridia bacterium]|nr:hypothetical protein [Clostridia bacterium]
MNNYMKITVVLIIFAILGFVAYNMLNPNIEKMSYEIIEDKTEISKIVTDSFLDILIEVKNYDKKEINYEDMLEATMRISRELDLFEEMSTDTNFYEYVPENTIHSMIAELTGKKVNSPIVIEDFYYLYNEESKYYYVVPVGTDWIHIEDIKEVKKIKNGDFYVITCSTSFSEDGLTFYDSGDIKVTIKHCPDNKYIRYQLTSMEHSKGTLEEI